MTDLLEKAFAQASHLPPDQQDALAKWLLEELQSEKLWSQSFEESQDLLSKLADEAIEEHVKGETKKLDVDSI